MSGQKLYTLAPLYAIEDTDRDFIKTMVETLLEHLPADLDYMVQSSAEKNWADVYKYAHKMKVSVHMLGIPHLADEVVAVEEDSRNGKNTDTLATRIENIQKTLSLALSQIREEFA